jgi:hypothetical protein
VLLSSLLPIVNAVRMEVSNTLRHHV